VQYLREQAKEAIREYVTEHLLNDMDERIHGLTQMGVERPELIRVVNNVERDLSSDVAYSYHILYTFAHVYHMRQRGVVSDNEWTGWLRWMKSAFRYGTIREIWKNNIEVEKWFDPAFHEFINKELASVAAKQ
jgi:hypothetical protein